MPDQVDRLERARRKLAVRQADLARTLRVTQGHYSKVSRRLAPPGQALSERIERWLALNAADVTPQMDVEARITALAASIQDQSTELLSLLRSVSGR